MKTNRSKAPAGWRSPKREALFVTLNGAAVSWSAAARRRFLSFPLIPSEKWLND
jgi:hypothetical protein